MIKDCAFQGDVAFVRISNLPEEELRPALPQDGALHVASSETGHHHVISVEQHVRLLETKEPLVAYLVAEGPYVDVIHQRSFDTHAPLRLEGGGAIWKIIRQREYSPTGWVRVAD